MSSTEPVCSWMGTVKVTWANGYSESSESSESALGGLYFQIVIDDVGPLDASTDYSVCKARLRKQKDIQLDLVNRRDGKTYIGVILLGDQDVMVEDFEFRQRMILLKNALKFVLRIDRKTASRVYFCGKKAG